jgi:membrane associated rhomboid family serine protease
VAALLPIGDEGDPKGRFAPVTMILVALNVAAFLYELSQPSASALNNLIQAWGVVPAEYSRGCDLAPHIPLPYWTTLLTSMFLHGGWAHLGGNMLYLWVFGDNVERRLGPGRYLFFYLSCGVAAALAFIAFNFHSGVPTVGASGAISGVLGGYLVLFPRNRVRVLTSGGIAYVPAVMVLGLWILIQVLSGVGSIAGTQQAGEIAYMAHIGGFVAGIVLVKLLDAGRGVRPALA